MPEHGLTDAQLASLTKPLDPRRVLKKDGQSHLPAFDVIAHLTRIFGFGGWDTEILRGPDLLLEELVSWTDAKGNAKKGWDVAYSCNIRLTIRNDRGNVIKVIEDGATGAATHQRSRADAHDLAYKTAISTAIKRCAKDLGDAFGLSLYNKGSLQGLIPATVLMSEETAAEHVVVPDAMGDDERQFEYLDAEAVIDAASSAAPPHPAPRATSAGNSDNKRGKYGWVNGKPCPARDPEAKAPSEAQLRRLAAICGSVGVERDAVKAVLGIEHGADMDWKQYAWITDALEAGWTPEQGLNGCDVDDDPGPPFENDNYDQRPF